MAVTFLQFPPAAGRADGEQFLAIYFLSSADCQDLSKAGLHRIFVHFLTKCIQKHQILALKKLLSNIALKTVLYPLNLVKLASQNANNQRKRKKQRIQVAHQLISTSIAYSVLGIICIGIMADKLCKT